MVDGLAALKRQWELGHISAEEYFIEKTRFTSTAQATSGAVAGVVAQAAESSKAIKLLVAWALGGTAVGAAGIGLYSFSHTLEPRRAEVVAEEPAPSELEAIAAQRDQADPGYRVPFTANFARTQRDEHLPSAGLVPDASSPASRPLELRSAATAALHPAGDSFSGPATVDPGRSLGASRDEASSLSRR